MAKTFKVIKNAVKPEKNKSGELTGYQVKTRETVDSGLTWQAAQEYKRGDSACEIVPEPAK